MMRSRLVLLSDLWGELDTDWVALYKQALAGEYDVIYFDSRALAGIDLRLQPQEEIHRAFVNGGIDRAAHALVKNDPRGEVFIGCSVGGVIAWRAALQ
ncbi:MAG: hypothetical protein AAGA85_23895, partial [Bacteroidota bacterium]